MAPELLGAVLVRGTRAARIVEVEAYCGDSDEAAHSFRGVTPRTEVMFGPPGFLYVYFIYGMHWCANVVCGRAGTGNAVLFRAAEPVRGLSQMLAARTRARSGRAISKKPPRPDDLLAGPARLCTGFGIDKRLNGTDLLSKTSPVQLMQPQQPVTRAQIATSTRIGITKSTELPWRYYLANSPSISKGRPV